MADFKDLTDELRPAAGGLTLIDSFAEDHDGGSSSSLSAARSIGSAGADPEKVGDQSRTNKWGTARLAVYAWDAKRPAIHLMKKRK